MKELTLFFFKMALVRAAQGADIVVGHRALLSLVIDKPTQVTDIFHENVLLFEMIWAVFQPRGSKSLAGRRQMGHTKSAGRVSDS